MSSPQVRKPTAERRVEIATAVLRIIGERGLSALSTATLAEEVGVTSGALFRHFASLDEILRETVRHALREIEGTFPEAALPPVERLFQLARNRILVLGSDPGLAWLLLSEQAYLKIPADSAEELRGLVKRSRRFLLEALREGAREGSIRDDIEAEVLLVTVTGAIHALVGGRGVHERVSRRSRRDVEPVLDALRLMLAPPTSVDAASKKSKSDSTVPRRR